MRITEKQTQEVDVLTDVVCDVCGKSCRNEYDCNYQFATFSAQWGWGSPKDGEEWETHICEKCCDALPFIAKIRHRGYLPWGESVGEWLPMDAEVE